MRRIALVVLLTAATVASAQEYRPVDQGVGDLDALSISLRQVQSGIRRDGEQTSLYQVAPGGVTGQSPTHQPVYLRVAPGFQAEVNRIDYVVPTVDHQVKVNAASMKDGQFLEFIPPNTVFVLTPQTEEELAPPVVESGDDNRLDLRVDGRHNRLVDRQINTLIDTRVDGRVRGGEVSGVGRAGIRANGCRSIVRMVSDRMARYRRRVVSGLRSCLSAWGLFRRSMRSG